MDPHARAHDLAVLEPGCRGVTVLLTTHAMDEAEHLCDRVAIVTGGKLAALGSPAEPRSTRSPTRSVRVDGRARRHRHRPRARARRGPGGRGPRRRIRGARRGHAGSHRRSHGASCATRRHARRTASRTPVAGGSLLAAHRGTGGLTRAQPSTHRPDAGRDRGAAPSGENLVVTLTIPLGILVFFAKVDTSSPTSPTRRFPRARRVVARGHGFRNGVARHRHRIRTPLRRAEAPRRHAVVPRRVARRQDRHRARVRGAADRAHRGGRCGDRLECARRILPAIGLLLVGTVAFAGIGLLMAGTLRAEANLAAANGLFPRSCSSAGWRTRSRSCRPRCRTSPSCCPQPRCRRRSAPRLGHAFPTGGTRGLDRLGGRRAARRSATSAGRNSSSRSRPATADWSSPEVVGPYRRSRMTPLASMKMVSGIEFTS